MKLDAYDHRILAALQRDGRLSNVQLAEEIGLSPSPCLRRVRLLEEAGVIRGYQASIDRDEVASASRCSSGSRWNAPPGAGRGLPPCGGRPAGGDLGAPRLRRVGLPPASGGPRLRAYERLLSETLLRPARGQRHSQQLAIKTVKAPSPLPLGHLAAERQPRKKR